MKNNFTLTENETVLAEIKHSALPFIGYWLLAVACCAIGSLFYFLLTDGGLAGVYPVIIFVICSLCGIALAVILVLSLSSERLILTNKRVIGTKGFLARRTTEIVLDKADAVTVSNSMWGAIFKYSSINVVTPGLHYVSNGTTVGDKFGYVVNADEFSTAFYKAVEDYKVNKTN